MYKGMELKASQCENCKSEKRKSVKVKNYKGVIV